MWTLDHGLSGHCHGCRGIFGGVFLVSWQAEQELANFSIWASKPRHHNYVASSNELHPRNQFENEINAKFADIVKFLKKEYKKITKSTVSLTEDSDPDIMVQTTSRHHTWVQAKKQYAIGGFDGVESVRMGSERSAEAEKDYHKKFLDFLAQESNKRPENDKAPKNPETPEA